MPSSITMSGGKLNVPDQPILPFIEGDGTGPDIWSVARGAGRRPERERRA